MRLPDHPTRLAISAALLSPDLAVLAWQELLSRVRWEDATESLQRCFPLIAVNLGCHSRSVPEPGMAIPHAQQLAGVYRVTWTANIIRIRTLQPLFDEFGSRSVDYRLLKGTALCALFDHWGSRRMGDVDVVVRDQHAARAIAALRASGFTPRFFRPVDDKDLPDASCWEGPQRQLVDLHIAYPRRRSPRIIDLIASSPPMIVRSQGRDWQLPHPAAMAVHATTHAQVGSASSDATQALLDLARLAPLTNAADLGRLARSAGATGALAALFDELRAVGLKGFDSPVVSRTESLVHVGRRITGDVGRLPRVVQERGARAPRLPRSHLRSWLYRQWFRTGQLRPLERLVFQSVGGFLRAGALDLPRDRRRRVVIPRHLRGQTVRLSVTCGDPYARLLFINGESHGVIHGASTVLLDRAEESIELSLRLLGDPPSTTMKELEVVLEGVPQA